MAMLLGCTGEMPPLYSALCFCFYFAYRYARLLDCRIGSMGSSHESRITRGQKRLRLLTGNCREYFLNLHGTLRWRIGRKRDRVIGEWIGGPDDLVGVRLHVAGGNHGVAIPIDFPHLLGVVSRNQPARGRTQVSKRD